MTIYITDARPFGEVVDVRELVQPWTYPVQRVLAGVKSQGDQAIRDAWGASVCGIQYPPVSPVDWHRTESFLKRGTGMFTSGLKPVFTIEKTEVLESPGEVLALGMADCLADGTAITVVNPKHHYETRTIDSLEQFAGYQVISYNLMENRIELKPITGWWYKGKRPVVRLHFNNGSTMTCTPDHRLFSWAFGWEELPASAVNSRQQQLMHLRRIPALNSYNKYITDEYLWVVGHYLAEGWHNGHTVNIANDNPKLRQQLMAYLDHLGVPYTPSKRIVHASVTIRRARHEAAKRGAKLRRRLLELGNNSRNKALTEELLSLSGRQLTALMEGYSAGDSWLAGSPRGGPPRKFGSSGSNYYQYEKTRRYQRILVHNTSSDKLAEQLALIHRILGRPVHSYLQKDHQGAGRHPIWRLTEYQTASYRHGWLTKDTTGLRVLRVEDAGEVDVFDISVADNHNFMLSNGLVVHNCDGQSILACSVLRNFVGPQEVYVTFGEWNGFGHAWVTLMRDQATVLETTKQYEACELAFSGLQEGQAYRPMFRFNDQEVIELEDISDPVEPLGTEQVRFLALERVGLHKRHLDKVACLCRTRLL